MQETDFAKFNLLMSIMGEMSDGNEEMKRPQPEKVKLYFEFLIDVPFETIKENSKNYFNSPQKAHFFPGVAILRHGCKDDDLIEAEAIQAFDIIKELMEEFYCPELGSSAKQVIIIQLESMNKKELIPLLDQWGYEIATGNTQVVRAQFLKSFKANKIIDTDRRLDIGKEPKQLCEILKGKLNE